MTTGFDDQHYRRKRSQHDRPHKLDRSKQESPVREIRTLGLNGRGLETDLRLASEALPEETGSNR